MRKHTTIRLTFALMVLLMPLATMSNATPNGTKGPYLDEWWWVTVADPAARVLKLRTGDLDIVSVMNPQDFQDLQNEGFGVTYAPKLWLVNFQLNLERPAIEDLNFRRALAHLVPRDRLTATLFGPLAEVADSMMPRSYGKWHNPNVRSYEYDPELAISILTDAGYDPVLKQGYTNAEPGAIDNWIDPKTDQPLNPLDFVYHTAYVEYVEFDESWADEMENIGIHVNRIPVDYEPWIYRVILDKDYDISGAEWFGYEPKGTPDYLWLFWHSSQDVYGGLNFEHFHNSTFDYYADIVMTSISEEEVQEASHKCQEILAEQLPNIALYMPYLAYAYDPGIRNVVMTTLLPYGERSRMQFEELGGAIKFGAEAEPDTLSPATWTTLTTGRDNIIYENLVSRNPYTFEMGPWIAEEYSVDEWTDASFGVETGTELTFWLRNDVYWHDGVQYTANDVKFSLEYHKHYQIPMYQPAWDPIVKIETPDPFTVRIFLNTTGLWTILFISEAATSFPKHIWNPNATLFGDPEGLIGIQHAGQPGVSVPVGDGAFRPWEVLYPGRETELTCAVGVGPWILPPQGWKKGEYIHTIANHNYFVRQMVTDINFDFKVNILDISTAAKAFGSKVGEPRYNVSADMDADNAITIIDLAKIARDFGQTWY